MDDRVETAWVIAELCRSAGVPAVTSEAGQATGVLLSRHSPSGVIVDVMMPDEDGFEALRAIAAFEPGLPVLLVTGAGDSWLRMGEMLGRAQGLRNVTTAPKPIRAETIDRFVETVRAHRLSLKS